MTPLDCIVLAATTAILAACAWAAREHKKLEPFERLRKEQREALRENHRRR